MRPDDRSGRWDQSEAVDGFGPLDADLEALDAELAEAGAHGRRALHGQTQPTRFFTNRLRERLLATYPVTGGAATISGGAAAPAAPADARPAVSGRSLAAEG